MNMLKQQPKVKRCVFPAGVRTASSEEEQGGRLETGSHRQRSHLHLRVSKPPNTRRSVPETILTPPIIILPQRRAKHGAGRPERLLRDRGGAGRTEPRSGGGLHQETHD